MPDFMRVPWYRWKRYRIDGVVREQQSGRPVSGLLVRAFDKDVIRDDHLGDTTTDAEGRFTILFNDAAFKDVFEERPDIYLCIFASGRSEPVHDTSYEIRQNAGHEEYFEIEIASTELPSCA